MKKSTRRVWTIIGALVVLGILVGGGLYLAFPIQMSVMAGLMRNYVLSMNAPAGTLTTETNAAYVDGGSAAPSAAVESSASAGGEDWPSYNRTLSSDRYSPLTQINTTNAGKLKVLCTYDLGNLSAFESGLLMVDGALIATTMYDIFSINPATCAVNWRTHEDLSPSWLPANRGPAYLDGMLFRGTPDGRVFAYDFKTGKRIWSTKLSDPKRGEAVTAAPIAYDGRVYIANAGGDFKGGKGHVFALDAKSGKVLWEFFLTPRMDDDEALGPVGTTPLDGSTWKNPPGFPISGAGVWTSLTLDTKTGALYVPGGNPAPDFAIGVREGGNLYTDSIVVLDAQTGNYRNHYKLVANDWHDWDASNPPVPIQTRGGKQVLVITPKDGRLYGYDLANNNLLYSVPVTRIENIEQKFTQGAWIHFCPGAVGGAEWNSPSYIPQTNLILVAEVEWCDNVRLKDAEALKRQPLGAPWSGVQTLNPFWLFGNDRQADGYWGGWVYAVDADNGVWKWRVKSNYPIVGAMTPTAGGVVFVGDVGGYFYALDAATGQKLWSQQFDGGVAGGVITYVANGAQKVAVAYGFDNLQWPVKVGTAKIAVLGLEDGAAASHAAP